MPLPARSEPRPEAHCAPAAASHNPAPATRPAIHQQSTPVRATEPASHRPATAHALRNGEAGANARSGPARRSCRWRTPGNAPPMLLRRPSTSAFPSRAVKEQQGRRGFVAARVTASNDKRLALARRDPKLLVGYGPAYQEFQVALADRASAFRGLVDAAQPPLGSRSENASLMA